MTTETLLNYADLCGVHVRTYEPLFHPVIVALIKNVEPEISNEAVTQYLQSEVRLVNVRRLIKSSLVRLTFYGNKLLDNVILGHVRHRIFSFTIASYNVTTVAASAIERPIIIVKRLALHAGQLIIRYLLI